MQIQNHDEKSSRKFTLSKDTAGVDWKFSPSTDYEWNLNKYELIRRTMKTISDLICSYPQRCEFLRMRYMQTKTNEPDNVKEDKDFDYAQCLVVFYIMATVGSDRHLIRDYSVCGSINSAFRAMLDRYVNFKIIVCRNNLF